LLAQKKKNQKEKAAVHLAFGYPVLLKITGRCETHGVHAPLGCSNSPRALPVIFPLLGCVKWLLKPASSGIQVLALCFSQYPEPSN